MIKDHLQILNRVIRQCCTDGKVVPSSILFFQFENIAKSGMELYKFKKALSFIINNRTIIGYDIKRGRNGGVYKTKKQEKITITCSSGKFIGYISIEELKRVISQINKESIKNGTVINRPRSKNQNSTS